MTSECISCTMENAFFNGLQYECPDCDHVWDAPGFNPDDVELELDFEDDEEDDVKKWTAQEINDYIVQLQEDNNFEDGQAHDVAAAILRDEKGFKESIEREFEPVSAKSWLASML